MDEYKKGDYNVICDICGMKYKRSECRKDWRGLLCCDECWSPRQPQLDVKGRADRQVVLDARPDKSSVIGESTLLNNASKDAKTIDITSVSNISSKDAIGITLNSGEVQWTFATDDPSGNSVPINDFLHSAADSGNTVYLGGISGQTFVGTVSSSDL